MGLKVILLIHKVPMWYLRKEKVIQKYATFPLRNLSPATSQGVFDERTLTGSAASFSFNTPRLSNICSDCYMCLDSYRDDVSTICNWAKPLPQNAKGPLPLSARRSLQTSLRIIRLQVQNGYLYNDVHLFDVEHGHYLW